MSPQDLRWQNTNKEKKTEAGLQVTCCSLYNWPEFWPKWSHFSTKKVFPLQSLLIPNTHVPKALWLTTLWTSFLLFNSYQVTKQCQKCELLRFYLAVEPAQQWFPSGTSRCWNQVPTSYVHCATWRHIYITQLPCLIVSVYTANWTSISPILLTPLAGTKSHVPMINGNKMRGGRVRIFLQFVRLVCHFWDEIVPTS